MRSQAMQRGTHAVMAWRCERCTSGSAVGQVQRDCAGLRVHAGQLSVWRILRSWGSCTVGRLPSITCKTAWQIPPLNCWRCGGCCIDAKTLEPLDIVILSLIVLCLGHVSKPNTSYAHSDIDLLNSWQST